MFKLNVLWIKPTTVNWYKLIILWLNSVYHNDINIYITWCGTSTINRVGISSTTLCQTCPFVPFMTFLYKTTWLLFCWCNLQWKNLKMKGNSFLFFFNFKINKKNTTKIYNYRLKNKHTILKIISKETFVYIFKFKISMICAEWLTSQNQKQLNFKNWEQIKQHRWWWLRCVSGIDWLLRMCDLFTWTKGMNLLQWIL